MHQSTRIIAKNIIKKCFFANTLNTAHIAVKNNKVVLIFFYKYTSHYKYSVIGNIVMVITDYMLLVLCQRFH